MHGICLFVMTLCLISTCYANTQYYTLGPNDPERKTHCDQEDCQIQCLAAQCGNERIKATPVGKLVKTWKVNDIEVHCEEEHSCNGRIVIDTIDAEKAGHSVNGIIRCDQNPKKTCYGAQFVFAHVQKAVMVGDSRESEIFFKNANIAAIWIDNGPEEQFFMNKVFTEKVHYIHLRASAKRAMVGSYFDLTGTEPLEETVSTVKIECNAQDACLGSIFVFKKCGGRVEIICGQKACDWMSILVLNEKCPSSTNPTAVNPTVLISYEGRRAKHAPLVYVVCEAAQDHCVKQKSGGANIKVLSHDTKKAWIDAAMQNLKGIAVRLKQEAPDFTQIQNPNEWIREPGHREYLMGVTFEAALGTVIVGGITEAGPALIGAVATGIMEGVAAGAIVGGLGVIAWPLVIPGVLAVGAYGGRRLYKAWKANRFKIPTKLKAFEAKTSIYNKFEEDEGRIQYDLLTGDLYIGNDDDLVQYSARSDFSDTGNYLMSDVIDDINGDSLYGKEYSLTQNDGLYSYQTVANIIPYEFVAASILFALLCCCIWIIFAFCGSIYGCILGDKYEVNRDEMTVIQRKEMQIEI